MIKTLSFTHVHVFVLIPVLVCLLLMYPDSKNRKFIMINLVENLTPNVILLLHFFFEVAHKIITNCGKVETLIFQTLKAVSGPIWPNFELE